MVIGIPARKSRRIRRGITAIATLFILSLVLVACGGGDDDPTPTPAAAPTEPAAASPAATEERQASSPVAEVASPAASSAGVATPPVAASPSPADDGSGSPVAVNAVAAPSLLTPLSREEFRNQLEAEYPMEEPDQEGGVIVVGESTDISTVNGLLTNDAPTIYITGAIFEGLIGVSPVDGRPVPGLADSWEVSDDGLTYTFHLNTEARFHDGVDVTAEDVAFSFDAALDPNTGFFYRSIVNDAIDSYQVIDDDTFEVVARDRTVTFLYEGPGAVVVMPRHIWGDIGPEAWSFDGGSTGQDPSRVIGTGPFKFKEWIQGDRVTIVRNPDYYDKVPYIDELTIRVLPNADASVIALQQDEIDVMEIIPPAQTQAVQDTEGLNVEIYDFFQFTYYAMNLDSAITPLFQDQSVRQALFYALDRDAITQNIFLGFGEAAIGTQPPISPAYAPDRLSPDYAYDPDRALELLADAGWVRDGDDGPLKRDGEEFQFEFVYAGGDSVVEQIVSYMQEAWDEIGVNMEPRSVAGPALLDALESHEFDMALLAVTLSPDGSQTALFSCDSISFGLNFSSYCSEEWDALDDQQRREFDPDARTEVLIQQSQTIWEDQPIGVLRFGVARTGYNTSLHNFYPNGYGFLWSLPYVWVEG
jgi:peptide/nickel transport system substrate-binding protein